MMDLNNHFANRESLCAYLSLIGQVGGSSFDIFPVALAYAGLSKTPTDSVSPPNPTPYITLYESILADVRQKFFDLCAEENSDDARVQALALRKVFAEQYGFFGDSDHYDDRQNANIMDVMDRCKGLPIALSILVQALADDMGWQCEGVNFPGHFFVRLSSEGLVIMLDPFQGLIELQAKDLRLILKNIMGEYAELSADYTRPCSKTEMILRLQNNIKYRLIDDEEYQQALTVVEGMRLIAPNDYRLSLDMAVLSARLDQTMAAIRYIKEYIHDVPDDNDRHEAEAFLQELYNQI